MKKKEKKKKHKERDTKKTKREKKERERKKERVRESHSSTHSSSSCTQTIKRLLLFLSKPLLLRSDRSGLQGVLFPHTRQEYHTPSLQQASGKYTQVSKGKVHQSFMFISTWAEFIKSCFLYLCLYALVWMFSYGTSIGFLN